MHDLDWDDYPTSTGLISGEEFYNSFLQFEEMKGSIPRSELPDNEPEKIYNLVREMCLANKESSAFFRRSDDAADILSRLWLSRVKDITSAFFAFNDIPRFTGISKDDLSEIAKLSIKEEELESIDVNLLKYGIIVVYEPSIPGIKLDGAVFKLPSGNPVIALSLRHSRLDNYWFTLMHELAHVSLHYDLLDNPILDDLESPQSDIRELEADKLASQSLISRSQWRSCSALYSLDEQDVRKFATEVGVHPAIVAGRIRKETGRYNLFSKLIKEVNVREVLIKK